MQILINTIDGAEKLIGFMRMPSYRVSFHSAGFEGSARFVPASGVPDACAGSSFSVEVAQEYVTDFAVLNTHVPERIVPEGREGSYRVFGIVHAAVDCSEPPGARIIYVVAGDAFFTLTLTDTAGLRPNERAMVEFVAHEMSLWDDAI